MDALLHRLTTKDVERGLADCDEASLRDRATRAAWICELGQPVHGWAVHGVGTIAPWREMRDAFISGYFLGSILLAQVFVENLLASALKFTGEPAELLGYHRLLEHARQSGWISPAEFLELDAMRALRNPHAHFRDWSDPESLLQRSHAAGVSFESLLEHDCRRVITTVMLLANRPPFALGETEYAVVDDPNPDQMTLW